MSFSTAAIDQMLNSLDEVPAAPAAGIGFLSLHTAYSTTGANEAAGGSYARKAAVWGASSAVTARQKQLTNVPVLFDIPAGTFAWLGFWSLVTGGTFFGMVPLAAGARRQFNVSDAADVTANTIDSPAHGLSAGQQIVVWAASGAGLPAPLAEGTIYFVIAAGLTTDVFSVSATSGGAAIDITANGDGEFQTIIPETYAAPGQMNITAAALAVAS